MARFIIQTRAQTSGLDFKIAPVGFSWAAFFLGPLWLINQGAWAAAIADAGFLVLINLLAEMVRPGLWPLLMTLWVAERLFIGFEAFDALRAHWTAQGFVQKHLALGQDEEEALARWLAAQKPIQAAPQSAAKPPSPKAPSPSNGLFPLSGLMGKWAPSKSPLGQKP
jgi:hypothetical protein